jgi:hypothetical protein
MARWSRTIHKEVYMTFIETRPKMKCEAEQVGEIKELMDFLTSTVRRKAVSKNSHGY